jgi:hypothetical protein
VDLTRLRAQLRPSELALRDWVRDRLTAEIVLEIASMEYGQQVADNQYAIEELLAVHHLPAELLWPPRAVLELASYHRCHSEAEHIARLFSCLVLIRADYTVQPAETMAALVESALELGPEATEHAVSYLAWCRLLEPSLCRDDPEAQPFLTLGLLLTYLASPLHRDAAVLLDLVQACMAEVKEAVLQDNPWWPDQPPQAVLRKAAGGDGWRKWRALTARCLVDDGLDEAQTLREWFTPG